MNLSPLRRFHRVLVLGLAFSFLPAFAGPYTDALGMKLVASTTPAEKLALVRWIFSAMALHPEVKDLASITPEKRAASNKMVGKLVTRLLTEDCAAEVRDAVKYEGPQAIGTSFQLLGQVAAREIFGHANVAAGLSEFEKSVDEKKIEAVLKGAK